MIVNDHPTRAEVRAAFDAYEAALMADDLEALGALFWRAPHTMRYGVGEMLYGIDAIDAFRTARKGSPQRTLTRVEIVTFGADMAVAHAEFARAGEARAGRQTQTWVRFAEGWRIVSAHVSLQGAGA